MTRRLLPAFAAALPAAALLAGAGGCGGKPASTDATADVRRAAEDPWPKAVGVLRKDTDPATCRRVLATLGTDLAAAPSGTEQPAGLTGDAEKAARDLVGLAPDDLAEVRTPVFSPLDAAYLASCYYLRDAARSLESATAAPARQADAAFAWTCRQVELRPWLAEVQPGVLAPRPPLPPVYVLRRGSGSGLERAFVFLAVLQQLGLDGCLIGPADAREPGPARGAFTAVGVRVGPDLRLYDPWKGVPVTDPAAALKGQTVFAAVPLSALAPRNKLLEDKLREDAPVRLAIDPAAMKARFAEAKVPDLAFWNPAGDPFSYTRGLGSFLPADEGGKDTGATNTRLYDAYLRDQIPRTLFGFPAGLTAGDARLRLVGLSLTRFAESLLTPPTPREQIQRGHFFEATPALVQKRKGFLDANERLRTDKNAEDATAKWVEAANGVYAKLGRARLDRDRNPGGVADAEHAVDVFWKQQSAGALTIVDAVVADPGAAEATYLLALCKHEQAERAQNRLDAARAAVDSATGRAKATAEGARDQAAAKARDAWSDARDWWGRYEPYAAAQDQAYPGRAAHARTLAARAADLSGR